MYGWVSGKDVSDVQKLLEENARLKAELEKKNERGAGTTSPDFNQVRADGYHVFSCFNASIIFSFFTFAPE
ncbi:hypothetical protein B9C88_01045 [Brevibacillus laterosporus]|nr:hypothetical protein B9C88_01045 [Brevibacillus laterosporus]